MDPVGLTTGNDRMHVDAATQAHGADHAAHVNGNGDGTTVDPTDKSGELGLAGGVREVAHTQADGRPSPHGPPSPPSPGGGAPDIWIHPEMGVQLHRDDSGLVHFAWIKQVVRDATGEVYSECIPLKRNRYIFPGEHPFVILGRSLNDLCMDLETTPSHTGTPLGRECLVRIKLDAIERERAIVFTNRKHIELNYQHRGLSVATHGTEVVEEEGLLCCRHKFIARVEGKRVVGARSSALAQQECDTGLGVPEVELRSGYGRWPDGSAKVEGRLTAADLPAGGGGTARALKMAGLELVFVLDSCPVAARTLQENFPETLVLLETIDRFARATSQEGDFRVDVLHVSFPCQGHSWRNTGRNPISDTKNNETITALQTLLQRLRPRLVTLEQTDGIRTKNDGYWFRKTLGQLYDAGYAWDWARVNLLLHGVPQARRRLMIMAACPGQKLGSWPPPTHGPGLEGYATVREALRDIPPHATLHDIERHKRRYAAVGRRLPVADPDRPLSQLITTQGAQELLRDEGDGRIYWPTIRQQMRLMTFPDEHTLAGRTQRDLTTQIGNAVPCAYMTRVFEEIAKAIRESDEEGEAWKAEVLEID